MCSLPAAGIPKITPRAVQIPRTIMLLRTQRRSTAASSNAGGEASADDIKAKKITLKIHYPTPDLKDLRAQEDDKVKRFQEVYPNVEIVKDDWQYSVNEIGIKMASNEAPTFYNTFATEAKFLVREGLGRRYYRPVQFLGI